MSSQIPFCHPSVSNTTGLDLHMNRPLSFEEIHRHGSLPRVEARGLVQAFCIESSKMTKQTKVRILIQSRSGKRQAKPSACTVVYQRLAHRSSECHRGMPAAVHVAQSCTVRVPPHISWIEKQSCNASEFDDPRGMFARVLGWLVQNTMFQCVPPDSQSSVFDRPWYVKLSHQMG